MKFLVHMSEERSSICTQEEGLPLRHCIWFILSPSCSIFARGLKVPLVIQLTDDEKCMWKNLTVEESQRLTRDYAKDIIACGFDVTRTFIFSDFDYVEHGEGWKEKFSTCAGSSIISKFLSTSVGGQDNLRCLIPCTIDQRIKHGDWDDCSFSNFVCSFVLMNAFFLFFFYILMPCYIGSRFVRDPYFRMTRDVDLPFKYLSFFMDDDAKLEAIRKEYGAGRVLTGEVKQLLIQVLTELVERHRRARAAVTDVMVDAFMAVRPPYPIYSAKVEAERNLHAHL
ncbi:unnamed protein product [Prunus brigantina]